MTTLHAFLNTETLISQSSGLLAYKQGNNEKKTTGVPLSKYFIQQAITSVFLAPRSELLTTLIENLVLVVLAMSPWLPTIRVHILDELIKLACRLKSKLLLITEGYNKDNWYYQLDTCLLGNSLFPVQSEAYSKSIISSKPDGGTATLVMCHGGPGTK